MRFKFTMVILICLLINLAQFVFSVCLGEEAKNIFSNDYELYNCLEVKDKKYLDIAGFKLSEFDLNEVCKYAITKEGKLIVLGMLKSNKDMLVLKNCFDKNKETIVAQFNMHVAFAVDNVDFMLFYIKSNLYIILTYYQNASGNRVENAFTVVEVYMRDRDDKFRLIKDEKIQENNYTYSTDYENKEGYHAYAFFVEPEDQWKKEPGFKNINKIVLNDINNDGFMDILIWTKANLSRLQKDEDKENFIFDSERLYVMYFDLETMSFGDRLPLAWE